MSWEDLEDKLEKGPRSAIFAVGRLWFWAGLTIMVLAVLWFTIAKPFVMASKVTNADRVLYNYEYFFNQAEAKKAMQNKVDRANADLANFKIDMGPVKNWTYEDKTEAARLRSVSSGLQFLCEELVADYNAKAKLPSINFVKTDETPENLKECSK